MAIGCRGSLTRYVGLCNLILQQDERAAGTGVLCCIIASQITDMGVAGTRLTKQVAHGIIVAVLVLDMAAWCRVTPCCDQLIACRKICRLFALLHCMGRS